MSLSEAFRDALEAVGREGEDALSRLEALYDPGMHFADPIQRLEGREAFMEMNRKLVTGAKRLSFEVYDVVEGPGSLFAAWRFVLEPRGLAPTLEFEGTTWCRLVAGKIVDHRDYWDFAGAMADALPVVGGLYRRLVARLG